MPGLKKVTIHTDGACEGNPGPGGWAAVLEYQNRRKEISGGEPATTNNRMEMQAAIAALQALTESCEVDLFTDSQYLKKGISEWVRIWKIRGWRTVDKQPVKNADLWRQLDALAARHKVSWHWVKGHSGEKENERCDQLAVSEIGKICKKFTRQERKAMVADLRQGSLNVSQPALPVRSPNPKKPGGGILWSDDAG